MSTITFACVDCGQQLAVREEHVGRRVRCTACEHVQVVPSSGPGAQINEPSRQSYRAGQASGGAASRSQPADYDERTYRDDPGQRNDPAMRPRRSVKKKAAVAGGGAGLIALIALGLVLIGGGVAVYYFWGGVDEDLELVPSDAAFFVSGRPADVMEGHWMKELRKNLPDKAVEDMEDGLKEMKDDIGLDLEDIERVTFFMMDFDPESLKRGPPESMCGIFLVKKSYDQDKIKDFFEDKMLRGNDVEKETYKGKTLYVSEGREPVTLCFYSKKIILVGTEDGVKDALRYKGDSGALDEAKREASDSDWHLSFAMRGKVLEDLMDLAKKEAERQKMAVPPNGAPQPNLDELMKNVPDFGKVDYIGMFLSLDNDVRMEYQVACEDSDYAKEWLDKYNKQMEDLEDNKKKLKKAFENMPGGGGPDAEVGMKVMDAMFDVLKDLKTERDGSVVKMTLTIEQKKIEDAIDWVKGMVEKADQARNERMRRFEQPPPPEFGK